MVKYKIIFDREGCIGALLCHIISQKLWLLAKDGKVDLANATYDEKTGKHELIIDEEFYEEAVESGKHCPVNVITVEKIED
jgi:ferredoxin